jgi:hypothetical protein
MRQNFSNDLIYLFLLLSLFFKIKKNQRPNYKTCLIVYVGSDPLSNGQAVFHSLRSGYSNETNTHLTPPLFAIFLIDNYY